MKNSRLYASLLEIDGAAAEAYKSLHDLPKGVQDHIGLGVSDEFSDLKGAFQWLMTPQGYEYWAEVNNRLETHAEQKTGLTKILEQASQNGYWYGEETGDYTMNYVKNTGWFGELLKQALDLVKQSVKTNHITEKLT